MLEINGSRGSRGAYARPNKSRSPLRTLRNITLSVVIIGGLLVGVALAYAWYSSQSSKPAKSLLSSIKKTPPIKGPSKPSPYANIGVAQQFITATVAPGDNASMTIHTNADAKCTIKVVYDTAKQKLAAAHDSGLITKKADDYGLVTWTWTVAAMAPLGKAEATTLCSNLKNSGQYIGNFVVSKSAH